jgi:hypothetical protein
MDHPVRNIANNSSSGGGENNPPSRKIENLHKFPVRKKRKKMIQEEEDIEKIFLAMEQPEIITQQKMLLEVVSNEIFSEEECFTFQRVIFYESKKFIVERGDHKNKKGKSHLEVDLKYMWSSQISKIHRATSDALDDSIDGLEAKNSKLKEKDQRIGECLNASSNSGKSFVNGQTNHTHH